MIFGCLLHIFLWREEKEGGESSGRSTWKVHPPHFCERSTEGMDMSALIHRRDGSNCTARRATRSV